MAVWKVYLSKGHVNFFSQNSEKNNSVFQNSQKKQRKKVRILRIKSESKSIFSTLASKSNKFFTKKVMSVAT